MRRILDILVAGFLVLITSPLWVLAVIVLFIFNWDNPLFLHERVGRNGKTFRLVKLRTMRRNSSGSNLTVAGDSRVTNVGRILRKLKVDELPQLLNVLIGEMSIVGPRPETPEFVALYSPAQREILKYNPGLTDPSSIKYRYEEKILASYPDPVEAYKSIILPDKLTISLQYQRNRNIRSDIGIICRTIAVIFYHKSTMANQPGS